MKGLLVMDFQALKTQKKLLLILAALCILYVAMQMYEFMLSFVPLFLTIIVLRVSMSTAQQPALSRFLFTLPFTREQYIAEKYLLSIATCLVSLCAIALLMVLFGVNTDLSTLFVSMGLVFACTLLLVSVFVPVSLRFRENAVLWLSLATGVIAIAAVWLAEDLPSMMMRSAGFIAEHQLLVFSVASAVLILTVLLSAAISMRILRSEEF